ncbi:MAG TPA: hypothetical protein VGF01_18555 [Terracidiphilus sp.]|jgi:hypothetical protein
MNAEKNDGLKALLQRALPPVNKDAAPPRDLWPAMLRQLDAKAAPVFSGWALFDGALLAGLVGFVLLFPASIPLLLYYL